MQVPSIVLLTLANPREKYWGELNELGPHGATLRGLELNAFEDFLTQAAAHPAQARLLTSFFPMHRIERIALDECIGELPSLAARFEARLGVSVGAWLRRQENE